MFDMKKSGWKYVNGRILSPNEKSSFKFSLGNYSREFSPGELKQIKLPIAYVFIFHEAAVRRGSLLNSLWIKHFKLNVYRAYILSNSLMYGTFSEQEQRNLIAILVFFQNNLRFLKDVCMIKFMLTLIQFIKVLMVLMRVLPGTQLNKLLNAFDRKIEILHRKISYTYSFYQDVTCGVPQGFILRPSLFNIGICNMFRLNSSFDIASYADDSKPYISILTPNLVKSE